ncbi:hypothetical protein [Azohydromonas lata]|uniref:hypothetical protein n=1 Tax=Azohydromonas lata TaxID=45677 RepID=UPI0012F52820|nr:hypothetical protein [Azohydromonas lata]
MKHYLFYFSAIAVALIGCGDQNKSETAQNSASQPSLGVDRPPTKESIHSDATKPYLKDINKAAVKLTPNDLAHPISKYSRLDSDPLALAYLVAAQNAPAFSEEEKLARLSSSWASTTDAFQKREIAKSELPRIEKILSEYRDNHHYAISLSASSTNEVSIAKISLSPYDFSTKSFPIGINGQDCWGWAFRTIQKVGLNLTGGIVPCRITVEDESVAKSIEAARSSNSIVEEGTIFFFVPSVQGNVAQGVVTAARIQLINSQTNSSLGVFELKPQQ